jgi:hypothetical protein
MVAQFLDTAPKGAFGELGGRRFRVGNREKHNVLAPPAHSYKLIYIDRLRITLSMLWKLFKMTCDCSTGGNGAGQPVRIAIWSHTLIFKVDSGDILNR